MVKSFDAIPDFILPWIKTQKLFWVATAPLSGDGHVNVSPKGIFNGNFHVVDERRVWYEDLTGSGVETISHLRENGRITIMFSAFEGAPRICRLFGKGKVYEFGTPEYNEFVPMEKRQPGSRSVIFADLYQVTISCGQGVPFYSFQGERHQLHNVLSKFENNDNAAQETPHDSDSTREKPLPESGLRNFWKTWNMKSLDGLPGIRDAPQSKDKFCSVDPRYTVEPVHKGSLNVGGGGREWADKKGLGVVIFALGVACGVSVLGVLQKYQ